MVNRKVHKVQELEANQGKIYSAKWGRSGQLFASGGQAGHINVWRLGRFDIVAQLGMTRPLTRLLMLLVIPLITLPLCAVLHRDILGGGRAGQPAP